MARKSIEERLAQLDAQRKTLQARLAKQDRARDTRRKVLLGAFLLHRLENGKDEVSHKLMDLVRGELGGFLTRDADKDLFADLIGPPAKANGATGADHAAIVNGARDVDGLAAVRSVVAPPIVEPIGQDA